MWRPRARAWLARLDHAGVYLLIAGSYAPFGLIVMSRGWAIPILAIIWGGAFLAIVLKLFWVEAPKWLAAAIGLTLGWVGAAAFPQLLKLSAVAILPRCRHRNPLYRGRDHPHEAPPKPAPAGVRLSEQNFHVLTLAAAASEYVVVAFYVLPPPSSRRAMSAYEPARSPELRAGEDSRPLRCSQGSGRTRRQR